MKYIKSIGIELEGGFYGAKDGDNFRDEVAKREWYSRFQWGYDSSVNLGNHFFYNEVELRFWSYNVNEILEFVKLAFDYNFKQNHTCGNHIHIRTKRKDYYDLMSNKEFLNAFILEYKKKFKHKKKFLERLYNSYCSIENLSERVKNQIKKLTSYRYTAINFLSLKEKQKTLEFRIMPYADNFEEYKEMFLWLIETIEMLIEEFLMGKRVIEKQLNIIDKNSLNSVEKVLNKINNREVEFRILTDKILKV